MSKNNNGNPSVWKKRDAKFRSDARARRDAKKQRGLDHAELMAAGPAKKKGKK